MCLAVPARLVELTDNQVGTVDLHSTRLTISTILAPEAKIGDWLLIHAGFAIQRLDPQQAAESWAVLNQLQSSLPTSAGGEP